MKIMICDDNKTFTQSFRNKIIEYCAKHDYPCQCSFCNGSKELLNQDLSDTQLLFLDIDMPDTNGIETARQLRDDYPNLIIVFVTAFLEYAPYGYQVSAFRYLLKSRLEAEFPVCMDDILIKYQTNSKTISIQTSNGKKNLHLTDILYFEGSSGRKSFVHFGEKIQNQIECAGNLSYYADNLEKEGFLRIHRSFLVNMKHIRQVRNYEVILSSGTTLKSSRQYFHEVKAKYAIWRASEL